MIDTRFNIYFFPVSPPCFHMAETRFPLIRTPPILGRAELFRRQVFGPDAFEFSVQDLKDLGWKAVLPMEFPVRFKFYGTERRCHVNVVK